MTTEFRRTWNALKTSPPGQRFENRYNAAHRSRAARLSFAGVLVVVGGIALIAVGAVFLVIPGPGLPVMLVGAALLAGKFRRVAVALDWTELKLRRVAASIAHAWRKASQFSKNTMIAATVLFSAGAITVACRLFF